MGVYIKGMEMPKEGSWITVRIYPTGECAIPNWQGDCTFIKGVQAAAVPPHGDLIDKQVADELNKKDYEAMGSDRYTDYARSVVLNCLNAAPIIIPADKEKT